MPNINTILSNLNSEYEQITDLIPNKVFFVDDFDDAKNEFDQEYDTNPFGGKFYQLNNGKFIWVGIDGANSLCRNVRRYNSDYTLDETFSGPIFSNGNDGFVRDVVELSNGKLIIVGNFGDGTGKILKLNADGSLDLTFDSGVHFDDNALVVKLLSDGNILVGGDFSSYNGTSVGCLVKLSPSGVIVDPFTTNVSIITSLVNAIKEDSSGKIYVGGEFGNSIVRLNSDGTVDSAFNVGSGFNNRVSSIEIDSNGKIIVGGWFTEYNGNPCNPGIVRLETNGDLDSGFTTQGTGLDNPGNGIVQCLQIQSNGKILAGGWFEEYDGNRQGHIIRFNTDGTKDSSFDVGYGFGDEGSWNGQRVQSIAVYDNKIICVGSMKNYKGRALYGFASLSSDGTINSELLFKYTAFGISDGYDDMYDGGNFINTNLTQLFENAKNDDVEPTLSIPYTHSAATNEDVFENQPDEPLYDNPVKDGVVKSGNSYFGSGSSYFTNMYPGMFVLVAENINIEEFSITGDVGSDESTQNASSVIVLHEGRTYTIFVKVNREGSGGESGDDPSVNHLIIVPGEPSGLTQIINDDGDEYDDHCIRGLNGRKSLYYILVAREESNYLSDASAENIAKKFLEVIGAGCGSTTVELDLSPDNPETDPNYRFNGEGNLDTAIVVDPITGKRRSIQRTGYFDTVDDCGNRRVLVAKDGDSLTNVPTSWAEALGSIIKIQEPTINVYVFINSDYVDYSESGDPGSEASNIVAYMNNIEVSYETFTSIDAATFSNLSPSSKLLIPELEEGDLLPSLSGEAKSAIQSFVSSGGTLVMFEPSSGDLLDVLNDIFSFSLSGGGSSDPITLTVEGASLLSDLAGEIPNNNGTAGLDTTTLPEGSVTVYEGSGSNETVVAMIPYGSGKIYVLGWDWYNAVPVGDQDDGWLAILRAILES